MKKILLAFLFLILSSSVLAQEAPSAEFSPFGKYTILKTTHNYSPLRENADENAKRFSHLKKGITVYSDLETQDFFRIDLGLQKYYWIEKKYADKLSTANKKTPSIIKDIKFEQDKKNYYVKIPTVFHNAYNEIESSENSVDFILYDIEIDKELLKNVDDPNFNIGKDEFGNLKITYKSKTPLSGHEILYNSTGLILKVRKPFDINHDKPLSEIKIAIDPGHGGGDYGASAFDLKEKNINLEISKQLKEILEQEGAKVFLTRESDSNPDLYERIDFAKEKEADFLISIHQNSLADRTKVNEKHGVGVYYYNKETYPLAKEVQNALVQKTEFKDDGVNLASFALTRAQNPLCILVECGYIIHPEESKKISDPNFQKVIAEGIKEGIVQYLKNNF